MTLDPKNPEHRRHAIRERMAALQREGKTYDEAWRTMNSQADMQPFVAAMKPAESEQEVIAAAITQTVTEQMVNVALSAVERTLAQLSLGRAKQAVLNSPLFRPLAAFQAARTTANGGVVSLTPSETDATLESLAVNIAAQIIRAALDAAAGALANFLTGDNARAEVYTHPLFAPMIDWLKKTTGEDLRTGNSAGIASHALKHFIQGAVNRCGLPALRKLIGANPSFSHFSDFLKGEATANKGADLSSSAARREALRALVSKRQEEFGEPYDQAFAAVRADASNAALFQAMQQPTAA